MVKKTCSNCGTEIENAKFCPNCGQKVDEISELENLEKIDPIESPKPKFCPKCGTSLSDKDKFCPKCGFKIIRGDGEDSSQNNSMVVAEDNAIGDNVDNSTNNNQNNNFNNNQEFSNNFQQATKFCENCGSSIAVNAEICPKCGVRVMKPPADKSPGLALFLSFIWPGIGQLYNGQSKKAITLIIMDIISIILCIIFIGIIGVLFTWIYGMYDAYTSAKALNAGEFTKDKLF